MSYTPTEWVNGDIITAEKLNKLEEGIQKINEKKWAVVFDDSITTTSNGVLIGGLFTPTASIAGDSILVKFEDIVYELPKVTLSSGTGYGEFNNNNAPILTNYPCAIGKTDDGTYYFFTLEANTYEVEIKTEALSEFFTINISKNGTEISIDKTLDEILNAINNQSIVFIKDGYKHIHVSNFSHENTMGGQYLYLNGLAWGYEQSANELVAISYTLVISSQSEANIHEKTIVLTTTSNN